MKIMREKRVFAIMLMLIAIIFACLALVACGQKQYSVTIVIKEHGVIVADRSTAREGDIVHLTVMPDEGYELDKITIRAAKSIDAANVTPLAHRLQVASRTGLNAEIASGVVDSDCSFAMPQSDVMIDADFKIDTVSTDPTQGNNGSSGNEDSKPTEDPIVPTDPIKQMMQKINAAETSNGNLVVWAVDSLGNPIEEVAEAIPQKRIYVEAVADVRFELFKFEIVSGGKTLYGFDADVATDLAATQSVDSEMKVDSVKIKNGTAFAFYMPDNEIILRAEFKLAQNEQLDGVQYELKADGSYRVTGYVGNAENVIISNECNVTEIGEEAFSSLENLRRITLPNTVKTIGAYAFAWSSLEEIELPNCVEELGEGAFYKCTAMNRVCLSQSLSEIKAKTFAMCGALTSIDLPASLLTIGQDAFQKTNLTEVALPDGIKEVQSRAFASCMQLKKIFLPSSLETMATGALAAQNIVVYCEFTDGNIPFANPTWNRIGNDVLPTVYGVLREEFYRL